MPGEREVKGRGARDLALATGQELSRPRNWGDDRFRTQESNFGGKILVFLL